MLHFSFILFYFWPTISWKSAKHKTARWTTKINQKVLFSVLKKVQMTDFSNAYFI